MGVSTFQSFLIAKTNMHSLYLCTCCGGIAGKRQMPIDFGTWGWLSRIILPTCMDRFTCLTADSKHTSCMGCLLNRAGLMRENIQIADRWKRKRVNTGKELVSIRLYMFQHSYACHW